MNDGWREDLDLALRCFVSAPASPRRLRRLITRYVIPAVEEAGFAVDTAESLAEPGSSIFDAIYKGLRSADVLGADVSTSNPNVVYEIGVYHGWGRHTILLSQTLESVPFDVAQNYPVIIYNPDEPHRLSDQVQDHLRRVRIRGRTLQSPTIEKYAPSRQTLVLEFLAREVEPVRVFRFVSDFLSWVGQETDYQDLRVVEARAGSVGAWIQAAAEPIVQLADHILFFLPEWRKRSAESRRILAETEVLQAKANLTNANADDIRNRTQMRQVDAFLRLIDEAEDIGPVRITLGEELVVYVSKEGVSIAPPKVDYFDGVG